MAPTNTSLPQYIDYLADAGTGDRYAWSDASISVNLSGLNDSTVMLASAKLALQAWTATTGIVFTVTTGAADITIDNQESGAAYTSSSFTSAGEIVDAEINVGKDWMDGFPVDQRWGEGSYGLQTFIHEIGHALGLNHGGPYNGTGDYATDAIFAIDTYQYSVMSYFDQSNYGDASDLFLATPMIADIAAIRELYGAQPINVGDTAYGRSGLYDFAKYPDAAFTISDSAGFDTIDLRGLGTGARLDLNAGAFSDINGHVKNLTIAQGAAIERAYGTESADTIKGDAAANQLYGFGGADILSGGDGNDILQGGVGNDRLSGGAGADRLWSGAGADRLAGGTGADQFRATAVGDFAGDLILDFTSGIDDIVLSNFDANPSLGGDQAFRFLGAGAFDHQAGALIYAFASADTYVRGDIDGDGLTDFSIRLDHEIALKATDFIL